MNNELEFHELDNNAETLARDFGVARQRLASFLRNMEYREDVRAWASGGRQVVAR